MPLIIEGPDGSGKTTLARRLTTFNTHDLHYRAMPPGQNALNFYRRLIKNAPAGSIFDRLHLSEVVYAPILRGKVTITPRVLDKLCALLALKAIPTVLCLPPFEQTLANIRKRKEIVDLDFLARSYAAWLKVVPFADVVFDYTTETIDELFERSYPSQYKPVIEPLHAEPVAWGQWIAVNL